MNLPVDRDYVIDVHVGDPDLLCLLRGNIAEYSAEAIVNAANSYLAPGAGVCGAIHNAGGPAIAAECRQIFEERGSVPQGQAVATTAGLLKAKYVIHTVGPVWSGGSSGESSLLADCYRNSILLADDLGLHSIAFPAISTGVFGYPMEKAATVAIRTVVDHLPAAKNVTFVSLILFDRSSLDAFAKVALSLHQLGRIPETSIGVINA